MKQRKRVFAWTAVAVLAGVTGWANMVRSAGDGDAFRQAVETDWALQEKRLGRAAGDSDAIREALRRAERLYTDLSSMRNAPDLGEEAAALASLRGRVEKPGLENKTDRLGLYHEVRWLTREMALKNPLVDSAPVVFLKRRRFICQMLHEYLGYFYDYREIGAGYGGHKKERRDIEGGSVCILKNPGRSFAVTDLIGGRLPRGNYTTLSLSFDAQKAYFAFVKRIDMKPDFYSPNRPCFHIYAMDIDGEDLRQLTFGTDDNFDPCELPDGGIAFMSTRRGGFGRCHNPWEPLPSYTLHRMDPDGSGVRTLSFHETNEWHPSVLSDGRIVYTRWDYVDRSAAHFHGLWATNPDGSNPMGLFGNYTQRINACFQARAIPGSDRIVFVAGAHHADVGGSLVVVDPSRVGLDAESGEDDFGALEFLTPEVRFPEAPGWPESYFHSPWPLSENYYLVSFSFAPLPGMGPDVFEDTETGIYLFDRFGNLELLYREKGFSSMYPIPLAERPKPPVVPSTLDPNLGDEGEFMLADVSRSQFPLPSSRPVRALRVFQILPKTESHVANQPRLGYANAESARMLLGTVPVEADGSAYFRAPARKPLAFQAVDEAGRAVQGMRSVTYLQAGERRGCVGCHEPRGTTPLVRRPMATQREPSEIQPGPDGSHPWSYPRLVQPILDTHCIQCHNGASSDPPGSLAGEPRGEFTVSYEYLKPYARWFEWGGESIDFIVTKPGRMPADASALSAVLGDANHADQVRLSEDERGRIYLWLDGNASFYGAYSKDERLAQRGGEAIPPPWLQ